MESLNLREYVRVKEDGDRRNSLAGLTLSAVLANDKRQYSSPQVNRTLLDIIRDDPNGGFKDNKKSWKIFRDKLRLRRAGAAWTSAMRVPASDIPIQNNNSNSNTNTNTNRMSSQRNSARFTDPIPDSTPPESTDATEDATTRVESNSVMSNRGSLLRSNSSRIPSLASTRRGSLLHAISLEVSLSSVSDNAREPEELRRSPAAGDIVDGGASAEGGGEPVRMSLMALLAETDREMGLDGSAYTIDDEEEGKAEEEIIEEEEKGGVDAVGYNNCCVCMLRHKGAAFIPCGHTFCRLCSRELWVQRGNCPLCNGFILEILDIF